MELRLPPHLGVVAIEKGAFRSPSTKVPIFTYFTIYIYIYIQTHAHTNVSTPISFIVEVTSV